jgi:bacillithiol biosynthesis cysteine-adding enzyme BshC
MNSINSNSVKFYPKIIKDYLSGNLKSKNIVDWEYSLEQVKLNKKRRYSSKTRSIVYQYFLNEYASFELTKKETLNIELFSKEGTFTITTGHQLMLLGGPMFFYTKIMDVIKLAKQTSTIENPVLPIFWMASEDHDYEEISTIKLFGKKITSHGNNKGPVGRIPKKQFDEFLKEVNYVLGEGEEFCEIKKLINKAFDSGKNLSQITKVFVRELFKDEGLLIIDPDCKELKTLFSEVAERELFEEVTFKSSKKHLEKLKSNYKLQVNPREINLFYIENEIRKRLIKTEGGFSTSDNSIFWTYSEMKNLIFDSPEKISPNVLLRAIYQEILLPDLAYVGGAGEISYWLELKPVFDAFQLDFPIPLVRSSYFVLKNKSYEWLRKKSIKLDSLFEDENLQINRLTKALSSNILSFENEKLYLQEFYSSLSLKGKNINPQLEKIVLGEEKRANSALKNVEKRFLNAEKKKHEQELLKLKIIIYKLFPEGKPMERVDSFIPFITKENFNFKDAIRSSPSLFEQKIVFV